jgi:hypothetical protein
MRTKTKKAITINLAAHTKAVTIARKIQITKRRSNIQIQRIFKIQKYQKTTTKRSHTKMVKIRTLTRMLIKVNS